MNLQKMMQQAQAMQAKLAEVQATMEITEMDGTAGGGAVTVRLNGKNRLLKVDINADLLKPEEKEMLEDLIVAAHNDAKEKLESDLNSEMGKITGGMGLPPGLKLPF